MSYQILPYHNPDSNNYKDLKPLMLTTSPSDLKGRSALGLLPLLTSNTDSVLWPNYAFTLALVRCLPRHVQDYLFCNREGQDVHDLACMADKLLLSKPHFIYDTNARSCWKLNCHLWDYV